MDKSVAARSLDRECPTCGAAPGERCKDTAFEGTTHFERLPRKSPFTSADAKTTVAVVNAARRHGFGVTVYVGRGWVFHWSTEDGFQRERAEHRTLRLGFIMAVRHG